MDVQETLMADLKRALRDRDNDAKRTIRMALAALKNERVAKNQDLTQEEQISVLQGLVKQYLDAIVEYEKGGRDDLVAETKIEIEILQRYLPRMLSRAEVLVMVQDAIVETGASSPKQMGEVMRVVMPRVQGRADGRMVSEAVRELLRQ